jgi:hypothetical protein
VCIKGGPKVVSVITILLFILVNYEQISLLYIRGPFERFVDWWQCATVMQREVVTVMPICSGGGDVVVA